MAFADAVDQDQSTYTSNTHFDLRLTLGPTLLTKTILTLSQMTNFRLFQIERVSKRQFQI